MKNRLFHTAAVLLAVSVILFLSITIGQQITAARQPGLLSFAIINFIAYLFFIMMPVEALVPYYLSQGHNGGSIFLVGLGTALLAQLLDYSVGYLSSKEVIHHFIGQRRYEKAEQRIRNYGGVAVFLFNVLPLPSPLMSLAAGMVRFSLRRTLLHSFMGLAIKYIGIIAVYNYVF